MLEKSKEKAITLIALVVTIVVLLILAAVSIQMLGGEDGIIKQAVESKDKNTIGEEKEQVEMAYVSAAINKLGDKVTATDLQTELEKNVGESKTETSNAKDENGNERNISNL